MTAAPLMNGYTDVPAGKLAFVTTSLQMLETAPQRPEWNDAPFDIRPVIRPDLAWYRDLYQRVGGDWLWFSRLQLTDVALSRILHDPDIAVYGLARSRPGAQTRVAATDRLDEGLLELDFRTPGHCEIAFFGVTQALIGQGAGRQLMNAAIAYAWERPINRLWLHTCTGDHPGALAFYIRSGFTPYKRQIEIADDPRLTGLLPETTARHVPLLRGPSA